MSVPTVPGRYWWRPRNGEWDMVRIIGFGDAAVFFFPMGTDDMLIDDGE